MGGAARGGAQGLRGDMCTPTRVGHRGMEVYPSTSGPRWPNLRNSLRKKEREAALPWAVVSRRRQPHTHHKHTNTPHSAWLNSGGSAPLPFSKVLSVPGPFPPRCGCAYSATAACGRLTSIFTPPTPTPQNRIYPPPTHTTRGQTQQTPTTITRQPHSRMSPPTGPPVALFFQGVVSNPSLHPPQAPPPVYAIAIVH